MKRAAAILVLILGSGAACSGDSVIVPPGGDPFLWLVLGEQGVFELDPEGEAEQYARLLTMGSVTDFSSFRTAERFEMRPAAGGPSFAWNHLEEAFGPGSYPGIGHRDWNYHLPDAPADSSPGAADIQPLGTYALVLETEGLTLTGIVTMPGQIVAARTREGDAVAWSRVEGAAGYRVLTDDNFVLMTDTVYRLNDEDLSNRQIVVQALEPNFWNYLSDPELVRAGIEEGLGVFGGLTQATVSW